MLEADLVEMMTETEKDEYLNWLRRQDAALEQIELLLYKMHRLAQQAAALEFCSDERRQQRQEEMEALKAQIDRITTEKLRD